MKNFVHLIIAFVTLVAADVEWKPITERQTLTRTHEICRNQTVLTTEQINKIADSEFPDEKPVHEYVLCVVTRMGIFTEDKGYNLDRLVSQFDAMFDNTQQITDILANCVYSIYNKDAPAERAYRGQQCIMRSKIGDLVKQTSRTTFP